MSKKNITIDQPKNEKRISKRKMRMGISLTVIALALIIIFMPKKTVDDKAAPPTAPGFKKQGELNIIRHGEIPIVTIDIEIADDNNKREIGLMGRPVMDERQGMLFIFEKEHIASFWMKNTVLPLDMIFINKLGKIVTICKNTKPFSEEVYTATAMTLFVLEVNAGFTDKYGIKEGDRISWKRL